MSRTRILVAEDNRTMANVLRFGFERVGYEVTIAYNGLDAIELARSEAFDFLVIDHEMPGANGFDVCRTLRSDPRYAETPVVFCTAKGLEIDQDVLRNELGVLEVVFKPFSVHVLVGLVETALGTSERTISASS